MNTAELAAALQLSEDPYFRALGDLASLKLQRGEQYNSNGVRLEDYFPLGRASYVQMCHVKTLRMRSTMGAKPIDFMDSAIDLANYAIFTYMSEKPKCLPTIPLT